MRVYYEMNHFSEEEKVHLKLTGGSPVIFLVS